MSDFDPPETPPPPEFIQEETPAAPIGEAAPVAEADEFEDTDPSALTDFKPALDPYGVWVEDSTYGLVWVPAKTYVGDDFAPYVSSGHWELNSNDDWVWVSDFDTTFGWVVFHYGRWVWASGNGWVWIPGRRYAPAWVVWRTGSPGYDYVGWAPMPPAYYWHSGAVVWLGVYPPTPYVFCSTTYIFSHHIHTHIISRDHVAAIANQTHPYGGMRGPTRHVLATPQRGPSITGGYVPGSAIPTARYTPAASQRNFATPRGMGRAASPRPSTPRTSYASPTARDATRAVPRSPTPSQPSPSKPPPRADSPRPSPRAPTPRTPSPRAPTPPPRAPTPRTPSSPQAPRTGIPRAPTQRSPSYSPTPRPSTPSRSSPSRSSGDRGHGRR